MVTPILSTKLHIPPLRRHRVPRQRLLDLLDRGLHRRLTLISAPAGFGKTTLLGEWLQNRVAAGHPPIEAAWISLDEGDNDPARFFAYLHAALAPGEAVRDPTEPQGYEWSSAGNQERHLVPLLNRVAARPATVILVLDDYHLIASQAIHEAVTFLIDHLPENLHLALATRADPALPLPRLRARGHLTELRQSDLSFTPDEAAAFLNQVMGLGLSAGDVAALETRTEGWIAGLQMASLALQARLADGDAAAPERANGSAQRAAFIRAFTGSHRFVLDYLLEEVLDRQPAALQRFLLQTSILERLSGPLCDALVDAGPFPDSQAILEHLEATNLFIVPLDDERRWYRYHRLFADLLRKRLQQTDPGAAPALHRRASEWHEGQGLMAAAIDHALAAGDLGRAADLIDRSAEATLMRSEIATFLQWVERLPEEEVRCRPTLGFYHAWALLMSGQPLETVEQRLQDVAPAGEERGAAGSEAAAFAGRMAALRAYMSILQADAGRAALFCEQALDRLPESDRFLRSIVAWILSLIHMAGEAWQDSNQTLQEVVRRGQEMGNPLIAVAALCHQARLQKRQGHLTRAHQILEEALRWATDARGERLPIASEALLGLGDLELEWNHLEAAEECLVASIELANRWSELSAFDAYFPLARVRLAQGDERGALQVMDTACEIARRSTATPMDDIAADFQQAYLLTTLGDHAQALRWAERRALAAGEQDPGDAHSLIRARLRKYEDLVLARLYAHLGRAAEALALLDPLLAEARRLGRADLILQGQILRALALDGGGQPAPALDALAEALSLAQEGGHIRSFADEGEPMARLLRQAVRQGRAPRHATTLLEAMGAAPAQDGEPPPGPALVEPLSEREQEVLQLMAAGLSNPEIAAELFVAVSTVRSHCKSIYGKLGVHRRWDAVQRAHDLGFL